MQVKVWHISVVTSSLAASGCLINSHILTSTCNVSTKSELPSLKSCCGAFVRALHQHHPFDCGPRGSPICPHPAEQRGHPIKPRPRPRCQHSRIPCSVVCHLTSAYSSKDSHTRNTNTACCSNKPDAGRDKVKKGGEGGARGNAECSLSGKSVPAGWMANHMEGGRKIGRILADKTGGGSAH